MKKILMLVLLIGAFGGFLWAQSTTDQSQQPADQGTSTTSTTTTTTTTNPSGSSLNGTIAAIDVSGNKITIMDPATHKATVYKFSEKTTFSRDNQTVKVNELKEGDTILFVSEKGKITSVTIQPSDPMNPPQK